MITNFVGHLENMSYALDFLPRNHAVNIIKFVREHIKETLKAQIVDILWKKDINPEVIQLDPIEPDYHPRRGETQPKLIFLGTGSTYADHARSVFTGISKQEGIWTFVYKSNTPVWISGISDIEESQRLTSAKSGGTDDSLDQVYIRLTEPVVNRASPGSKIPSEYLVFYEETDSIITIPMAYDDDKSTVVGVFSIEFNAQKPMDDKTVFYDLEKLAKCVARIWWKSDVHERVTKDSDKAIDQFRKAVKEKQVPLHGSKLGFYARPFDPKFDLPYRQINACLHRLEQAHARHYDQPATGQVQIDIIRKIKQARFGVADVTNARPNVMLELGMMLGLGKQVLIIKNEDDELVIPYNVGNLPVYNYSVQGETVVFIDTKNKKESLEPVIKKLIVDIKANDPLWHNLNPCSELEEM